MSCEQTTRRRWRRTAAVLAIGIAGSTLVACDPIGAAFTVTTTVDAVDAAPGDGVCEATIGAGDCTLRAAIIEANASPSDVNTISIGDGRTFVLTVPGTDEDQAATGDLDVLGPTTLVGRSIIDAAGIDRVLDGFDRVLKIDGAAIQGGAAVDGGGIRTGSAGALELVGAEVRDNEATGGGGGIHAAGTGTVTVRGSAIVGNAGGTAGGIRATGAVEATNTTVSGNVASAGAGGMAIDGTVTATLSHVTVADNAGTTTGGVSGPITAAATVIADQSSGTDCANPVSSLGYNADSDGSCLAGPAIGDAVAVTSVVDPLSPSSSWPRFHTPAVGGSLYDRIPPGTPGCASTSDDRDQRGATRPSDSDGTAGAGCETGAIETDPAAPPIVLTAVDLMTEEGSGRTTTVVLPGADRVGPVVLEPDVPVGGLVLEVDPTSMAGGGGGLSIRLSAGPAASQDVSPVAHVLGCGAAPCLTPQRWELPVHATVASLGSVTPPDGSFSQPAETRVSVAGGREVVADQRVVISPLGIAEIQSLVGPLGGSVVGRSSMLGTFQIRFSSPAAAAAATAAMSSSSAISAVEESTVFHPTTNDVPRNFSSLDAAQRSHLEGFTAIDDAWSVTTGSPSTSVGIIDWAFDLEHPSLSNAASAPPGRSLADTIERREAHGTHVASTVCGSEREQADGEEFQVGVMWTCDLHLLDIVAPRPQDTVDTGEGFLGNIASWLAALDQVGKLPRAVNMSFGYDGATDDDCNRSISQRHQSGAFFDRFPNVVFVVAAGNCGNRSAAQSGPAYEDHRPNVVSVAAVGDDGKLASFSAYGAEIAAPGIAVWASIPRCPDGSVPAVELPPCTGAVTHSAGDKQGTSMAAPIVTGTIGLMASAAPSATVSELVDCLTASTGGWATPRSSSTPAGSGRSAADEVLGLGLLDARRAVDCIGGSPPPYTSPRPSLPGVVLENTALAGGRFVAGTDRRPGFFADAGIAVHDTDTGAYWEFSTAAEGNIAGEAAQVVASPDGSTVFATLGTRLRAYTRNGTLQWSSYAAGGVSPAFVPFGAHRVAAALTPDEAEPLHLPGTRRIFVIDPSTRDVEEVLTSTGDLALASRAASSGRFLLITGTGVANGVTLCGQCLYRLDTTDGTLVLVGTRQIGTQALLSADGDAAVYDAGTTDTLWRDDGSTVTVDWANRQLSADLSHRLRAVATTCSGSCPMESPLQLYWSAFPSGAETLVYDGPAERGRPSRTAIDDDGHHLVFVPRYRLQGNATVNDIQVIDVGT